MDVDPFDYMLLANSKTILTLSSLHVPQHVRAERGHGEFDGPSDPSKG